MRTGRPNSRKYLIHPRIAPTHAEERGDRAKAQAVSVPSHEPRDGLEEVLDLQRSVREGSPGALHWESQASLLLVSDSVVVFHPGNRRYDPQRVFNCKKGDA